MRSPVKIIGQILLFVSAVFSQPIDNTWDTFVQKSKPLYHYLMTDNLQNFTCLLSTQAYLDFLKESGDTLHTYPLKFIWTRSGNIYYVLQPLPDLANDTERPKYLEKIQLMKNQFDDFYNYWLDCSILSPFDDIPAGTEAVFRGDTVFVSHELEEKGIEIKVRKIFFRSGRLVSGEVETRFQKVIYYPEYEEIEGRWLCTGWSSQKYSEGKITQGLSSALELQKIQNIWFPTRASVLFQTSDNLEERYIIRFFLKGFEYNLPLYELENRQSVDTSSTAPE